MPRLDVRHHIAIAIRSLALLKKRRREAIHTGSFDEFYYCLEIRIQLEKKLVNLWKADTKDMNILPSFDEFFKNHMRISNDSKIRQNYHCGKESA